MTQQAPGGGLVGLVVVSHSRELAVAAVGLAAQMVHGDGPATAVAAGMDDGTLGTDAEAIKDAIQRVDGPAGVVVLMDLGSAVLSAELALELADDPTLADRVTLSSAPLVEGLVAATVSAAAGASRAEVAAEANAGLIAKQAHLGDNGGPSGEDDGGSVAPAERATAATPDASSPALTATFVVTPEHGLHARPIARLVGELRGVDAGVDLRNLTTGSGPAPATSLTKVALLGALRGHRIEASASGAQADDALRRLVALAGRNFDEDVAPAQAAALPATALPATALPATAAPSTSAPSTSATTPGPDDGTVGTASSAVGASPGLAVGPVRQLRPSRPVLPAPAAEPVPAPGRPEQWRRLLDGIASARAEIERTRDDTARLVGEQEAGIFTAHLALLDDPELVDCARALVDAGHDAAHAWARVVDQTQADLAALDDPYLRARADDVRAVGDQVLRTLSGGVVEEPTGAGVLVARDLTPAQAAGLDPATVQAVVLAGGSATSHAAILARARGIPAVVGAGEAVLSLPEGTVVAVDGAAGTVVVEPGADVVADVERRRAAAAVARERATVDAQRPAVTRDGVTVQVACNVGSLADARAGGSSGADGAGLVRTELCFVGRTDEPTVEEQEGLYLAVAQALGGQRITLRTLDVGGDKPLPYLPVPHEDNPFLGLRGLRLSLVREEVFARQLSAIARVARRTPVSVMFPMVTTIDELRSARTHLDAALSAEGATDAGLQVGIMVEVPAVALKLESFAGLLDFVSVGTNDLTQYALAAERGNPHVAHLSDPLDPGVLALVAATCRASRHRFTVAVCGEAASDELAVPVLLGLGVDELSVSPYAVPQVKQRVRTLDVGSSTDLAQAALRAESAEQVRELVRRSRPA